MRADMDDTYDPAFAARLWFMAMAAYTDPSWVDAYRDYMASHRRAS